jgi:prevent-host-death family protein
MNMLRIIGVTELQRRFRSVFDEVVDKSVPYVLTRGSRPEAVLMPYEEFLRYQTFNEDAIMVRFDALTTRMEAHNAAFTDEEVSADVEVALAEL